MSFCFEKTKTKVAVENEVQEEDGTKRFIYMRFMNHILWLDFDDCSCSEVVDFLGEWQMYPKVFQIKWVYGRRFWLYRMVLDKVNPFEPFEHYGIEIRNWVQKEVGLSFIKVVPPSETCLKRYIKKCVYLRNLWLNGNFALKPDRGQISVVISTNQFNIFIPTVA